MRDTRSESNHPLLRGVRVGSFALAVLVWALLTARNERLRAEERTMVQRVHLTREIQAYRVSALEAQAMFPEPGSGDPNWWKDRLGREVARHQLTLIRLDLKPVEAQLGPYAVQRRELVVAGTFEAVLRFVGWLETAPPRARIERFALEPSPPGNVRLSIALLMPGPRAPERR